MTDQLYHYCPTPTAFSILQSRTMRLSALSAANDSLEGRFIGKVFSQALDKTGLSEGVKALASIIVGGYVGSTEGFAFCLSEDGDLLSQWRAYGDDGRGISIGFNPEFFQRDFGPVAFGTRFAELLKVTYGEELALAEMAQVASSIADHFGPHGEFIRLKPGVTKEAALHALADRGQTLLNIFVPTTSGAVDLLNKLMEQLAPLHFKIYGTKARSFYEEREWRIIRYQSRLAASGIHFVANDAAIKPYIASMIADPAKHAITSIVLGPKHHSDINWVRAFLSSVGLEHVKVTRSTINSYR